MILIQLDGLSFTQFHKALVTGRLPFLGKRIAAGNHVYKPMYSGMPSTTPAFQGELFYGVKSCVPAFEFISRSEQQRHISFYPQTANRIGDRLEKAAYIADHLDMSFDFFTLKESPSGRYGLAILSRFPIYDLNCGCLPAAFAAKPVENRGVMMAQIESPLGHLRVLNTHLGLRAKDRKLQPAALVGSSWVCKDPTSNVPVILCGDFNAGPGSFVYKTLSRHLADIQKVFKNRRYPRPTFASWLPVRRIDHIFISRHFSVKDVKVPMDYETRMVSDHLPLYGEIAVIPS